MKEKYHIIWYIINRFVITIYSLAIRFQFACWGSKSRIEPFAKLTAPNLVSIGSRVHICEHAWLNTKDDRGNGEPTLSIGDGTYIGRFVHINAWREVIIEKDVLIADRVFISDADHKFEDLEIPISRQGDEYKGSVIIKSGSWLGIGAVILPGVTIGLNSVVGANSVVTKDVPDYTIVAGIPARIIKQLKVKA